MAVVFLLLMLVAAGALKPSPGPLIKHEPVTSAGAVTPHSHGASPKAQALADDRGLLGRFAGSRPP